MCGFFGVFDESGRLDGKELLISRAGGLLSHRGPDDDGFYGDNYFGVSCHRLSILDSTQAGHQPMISSCGNYVIAFNGEIYNYQELRSFLEARGHVFKSHCDTEVVIHLYRELGENSVPRLRGMFAFAVWNRQKKELALVRDRFGIKPLYFYQEGCQTIFGSEIKSILHYSPQAREKDSKSIFKYLARNWVDDTHDTFYKNIKKIPPATVCAFLRNEPMSEKSYWSLRVGEGRPFVAQEFREKFFETVSQHLQADVPVASLLSGGLDSSSIVAAARERLCTLTTFSLIPKHLLPMTPAPGGYKTGADESPWINEIVHSMGVDHTYLALNEQNFPDAIRDCLKAHDEPFQDSDSVHSFLLHREIARRGFKVLLVGEGGDESLGGYARFFYPYLYSLQTDNREALFSSAIEGAPHFMGVSKDELIQRYANYREIVQSGGSGQENRSAYAALAPGFIEENCDVVREPGYPLSERRYQNRFFAHLAHHIVKRDLPFHLRLTDRNAMAYGVEARPPMVDHEWIEQLFSYDYAEFMRGGLNKAMLRNAMKPYLPASVVNRTSKEGRPRSNAQLLYGVLREELQEMLAPGQIPEFFSNHCSSLFEQDCALKNPERMVFWFRAYVFIQWLRLNCHDSL